MPGRHQIAAAVLSCPDQIAGRFLIDRRDSDRGVLIDTQQSRQVDRVLGVGLDPITGRLLQLRGATTSHRTPAAVSDRYKPKPVGPAS